MGNWSQNLWGIIDYSEEENVESTIIDKDDQLSESEITILSELYKIIEKNKTKQKTTTTKKKTEAAQHLLRLDLLEKTEQKIEKHKDELAQVSRTC